MTDRIDKTEFLVPGMSIAFESEEVQLQKLRDRLRQMSDEELIRFGKTVRGLSEPRVSVTPDPWKAQLEEARAEWRRRYPRRYYFQQHVHELTLTLGVNACG